MTRTWTDDGVEEAICLPIQKIYEELLKLDFFAIETLPNQPNIINWTTEGYEQFKEWANNHYAEMERPELSGPLKSAWMKMDIYIARICLIIQLVRYASGETSQTDIEPISVLSAASLIDYFKAQACRFYALSQDDQTEHIHLRVIHWAERKNNFQIQVRDLISARLVQNAEQGRQLLHSMEQAGLGCHSDDGKNSSVFTIYPSQQLSKLSNCVSAG